MALAIMVLAVLPARADSLFNQAAQKSGTLISEKIARFAVGDLITVLVREKIDASTQADTNTKKESDVESNANAADNAFLIADEPTGNNILKPDDLPNWQIEAENETRNTGRTKRVSTLTTTITCFVQEVLENGNLRIQGEKTVTINREDSTLVVSGIVRPKDILPDNTVPSTQLANATVLLKGKGPLWNNQRRGLVTRFLDWFSPF
ncbi:MAG: flagellar basal body L-ring protein FlgH [Candidatus Hydrogenedentes bacterium]|nr:flagellar basal body L-ring protein FlgH [Candidatus Hydrogenedentota bacterium]MBI3117605.1 flagellar basal body L-ring protein FlgH [Candidatus Hydrogenedentota bacterium]